MTYLFLRFIFLKSPRIGFRICLGEKCIGEEKMICVAVDTTSEKLLLALIKGDETHCRAQYVGKSGHSALLMPAVKQLLDENGVSPRDLDAVAVNVGPGSFTGIRIGVSAMTALSFAANAKRISLTTFEIIAYNRGQTLAAVDAGHGNVYAAQCLDGRVISTAFYEAGGGDDVAGAVYEPLGDGAETLAAVVKDKAQRGEYVSVFEPFYMRKSQAEREAE